MKSRQAMTRSAMTFVEIMLAVFILGMSLLPVIHILARSTGQTPQERTQAAAAAFAGKLMNQFLYEYTWANLTLGAGHGEGWLDDRSNTGVFFQWNWEITDAWPITQEFQVFRTAYHGSCGGACGGAIEPLPRRAPEQINPEFCHRPTVGGCIFKNIALTLQWKGPGDTEFDEIRKMLLVVRRGMLEEPNL
jgi:type II secretory pathway pseudopilin PulG